MLIRNNAVNMDRSRREKAVIGARLRDARERARLSKEEAAQAAEAQVSAVEAWERGTSLPTLVQFRGLLSCYGTMSHAVLFGETPFDITASEAKELRLAAQNFSPQLRMRIDLVLTVLGRAAADPVTS